MSGVSSKYKRKISDENRLFQDEWETEYFVVPNKNSAATCLICRESITLKKYNISRHFTTKHKSFNDTFPPGSSLRNEKLQFFKRSLNQQQNVMSVALSQDSAVTKASYEICYILGKHMKPFTDAEIVKECFVSAADILFDKFSNKKQILADIKKIQLSDSTCTRRIEDISKYIHEDVLDNLRKCKFFSLAFDSSTDISATSQCSLFVRYCTENNLIVEQFLKFLSMKGQTRGIDYLDTICNYLEQNDIDIKKIVCVCTDGCPSMTGSENGFIALFKKKYNLTNLVTFHCFIHQENLIARAVNPDLEAVMKTVINIVNYIRAKELNHRKFTSLLEELKSEYSDVLLHTSVRWLSRGKVLERFFSLRHEIMLFLDQNNKIYPELQQDEWWCLLAFLCDITEKLNNVNQSLQGKDKIVSNMANTVFAFEEKISIFYKELQNKNLQNFSTMLKTTEDLSNISEKNCVIFLDYITALLNEFQKRFQDLRKIRKCLLLVENPWHLETTTIGELASVLNCNYSQLFDEFIDFKNDTNLEVLFKEKRENKEYVEFWSIVPQKYKMVQRSAQTLLTFFGSTYLCESSFSKMKYIKNLYRNKLTDSHLDDVIRLACSDKPDLDKVMKKRSQFQTSH